MSALPCGCHPCAEWCPVAERLHELIDAAIDNTIASVTPCARERAREDYAKAERALHTHLYREAA